MRRRTFLRRTAPLLAAPVLLNGSRLYARGGGSSWLAGLAGVTDRVLVIIQLEGGNDGLNMLIPVEDSVYYDLRPNLKIDKSAALPLNGQPLLRMHPSMSGMQNLYNDGLLAAVENIGYEGMNLSHFTGTEIWNTASGRTRNEFLTTGWIGRYLQREFPDYPDVLPSDPPAIEISPATSTLFTVLGSSISMSLTDPAEFYELVNGGPKVDDDMAPDNRSGKEWNYIDSINRQSQLFSEVVQDAATRASNMATYPANNRLAASLAIIARLIAGGLQTRVYKVTLGGFDTHSYQLAPHGTLLKTLSDAVKAFQDDLLALEVDHRVVGMTYSEFGRRPQENGSGSDHGTASPHFVFGSMVDGGRTFGGIPNLSDLNMDGNLKHTIDFACYYASILAPLFGLDDAAVSQILPLHLCDRPEYVPLYRPSGVATIEGKPAGGSIEISPNPARDRATVSLRLPWRGRITLALHDNAGRKLRSLYSGEERSVSLDLSSVSSGSYLVVMESNEGRLSSRFVIEH